MRRRGASHRRSTALSCDPKAERFDGCEDRFDLSWQVQPEVLAGLVAPGDAALIDRMTQAFLPTMRELDVAATEPAARG